MMELTDQEKVEMVARVVKDLMEVHGLAGFFVACAPTHATHALFVETAPWLRIKLEEDPADGAVVGVRVRSKLADYMAGGMDEKAATALQANELGFTVNALEAIGTEAAPVAMLALKALELVRARMNAETTSTHVGDAWGPKGH